MLIYGNKCAVYRFKARIEIGTLGSLIDASAVARYCTLYVLQVGAAVCCDAEMFVSNFVSERFLWCPRSCQNDALLL